MSRGRRWKKSLSSGWRRRKRKKPRRRRPRPRGDAARQGRRLEKTFQMFFECFLLNSSMTSRLSQERNFDPKKVCITIKKCSKHADSQVCYLPTFSSNCVFTEEKKRDNFLSSFSPPSTLPLLPTSCCCCCCCCCLRGTARLLGLEGASSGLTPVALARGIRGSKKADERK